jgi:hypothetical protein
MQFTPLPPIVNHNRSFRLGVSSLRLLPYVDDATLLTRATADR